MPVCKDCGEQNGIFFLKDGVCLKCREKALPTCEECGQHFSIEKLTNGICGPCIAKIDSKRDEAAKNALKEQQTQMFVATAASFPDRKITEYKGLARGSTVRSKHVGRDIAAGVKNIVGGEIKGYTEMLAEAREEALERMKIDAMRLGANAVVDMRFSSSTIDVGACELVAYGTAVVVEK